MAEPAGFPPFSSRTTSAATCCTAVLVVSAYSFVIVTHDFAQARRVCDRVAKLALVNGAGTLAAIGEPGTVAVTRDHEAET